MIDPVIQDTNEYHEKLARDARAIEAMVPVVREEPTVFEGFLMDKYPELFNEVDDTTKLLHFINSNALKFLELKMKWEDFILEEAKRRVEG